MIYIKICLISVFIIVLSGCSNKNAASKENFKLAINTHLAEKSNCVDHRKIGLREIRLLVKEGTSTAQHILDNQRFAKDLKPLVDEGIYNVDYSPYKELVIDNYKLTQKGQQVLGLSNGNNKVCVGMLEVDEIQSYTEPGNGVTTSWVKYTAKFKSEEQWIKDIRVKSPQFYGGKMSELKVNSTAMLQLMNTGWVVVK